MLLPVRSVIGGIYGDLPTIPIPPTWLPLGFTDMHLPSPPPRSYANLPNTQLVDDVVDCDIFSGEEPVDEQTDGDGENVGSAKDSLPDSDAASYTS